MPTSNILRALRSRHPLDTPRIRSVAGRVHIHPLSDTEVEQLWAVYSFDRYGDDWVKVDDEELIGFEEWLTK